jgi:hypothetical protein
MMTFGNRGSPSAGAATMAAEVVVRRRFRQLTVDLVHETVNRGLVLSFRHGSPPGLA